ncbi:hypothetical protein P280DRAFT_413354 [Massarina eburnea CBS 473.64]|uniref:Amino acid permease/ SLC12A domain-containing protein n=1 Tax=Massarina eburnea CBS 473.64 TaxID=1395130 RepID=A0A6A6RHU1_9PLEO|nr:hypothetical protein P280DRAFT_413354 [Massarina eburnea CBS 473.64]
MTDQRPLDRSPYYVDHYEHLDRVLNRPQLTGIGISGCIGVGVFVTSGSLIATVGSLGGPLSYVIAGAISACVLYTLTEMVASRPLTGALIDLPHHFLDPAAGFAVAASYSLANIFSMATLTAHSAELTALLKDNPTRHPTGVEVGINIGLIGLTTFSHCLGVKLYGKVERVIMVFKLCLFVLVCILMLIVNTGGMFFTSHLLDYTTHAFPPGFKPAGFNSTSDHFMKTSNVPDTEFGLSGYGGRLFSFLTAVTFTMFSCLGGEMTAMTAGESKEPWKDVPVVMSFVYLLPLTLYPFVLMSAAANVNYADPGLSHIWGAGSDIMTISPFVIAIQTSSLRSLSKMLHMFFIISAYTAANTALYVSSRSVFMLAQTYLPKKAANIFGRTNNGHTPLAAILLCSAFGFIALTGLSHHAYPRQTMSEFYTGSIACVYICECITFLKYKAGLERLEQRKIISRNDPLYISRNFKSRWQPLPAYIGIAGCSFIVIWSGIPSLWILAVKGRLTSSVNLKSSVAIACDVLGAYIGPFLFALFYLSYKYITPRSFSIDIRDLTPADYVLGDLAFIEGENPLSPTQTKHSHSPNTDSFHHASEATMHHDVIGMEAQRWSTELPENYDSGYGGGMELSVAEEREAQSAQAEERRRVQEVLERRPRRMERRLVRELWSCLVAD